MSPMDPIDILLVEDNAQDIELTTRALKKCNLANRLYTVENGVDALDYLFSRGRFQTREPSRHPKVVLLDIKLPKLNGLEVLRIVKENQSTRSIPVVMITSSKEDSDIQTAYRYGANSYVVKPVNFEDFMEAMSNLGLYWLLINQSSE